MDQKCRNDAMDKCTLAKVDELQWLLTFAFHDNFVVISIFDERQVGEVDSTGTHAQSVLFDLQRTAPGGRKSTRREYMEAKKLQGRHDKA